MTAPRTTAACSPDEIIVVDDGSTDNSGLLAGYAGANVISPGKNVGLSAARNLLWQNTDADIIVFVDADTVARGDLLEQLLKHYVSPEVGGVGGQAVEARIESIYDLWRKFSAAQTLGDKVLEDAEVLFGLCCSYRRSVLEQVFGFDPYFRTNGEDHDISIRVRQAGYRLVYEPAAVVEHYRTDTFGSLMRMLYRYELFTQVAKMRNDLPIENHYRTFWRPLIGCEASSSLSLTLRRLRPSSERATRPSPWRGGASRGPGRTESLIYWL